MKVFTGCLTDRGRFREKNQDRAVCCVKKNSKSVLVVGCVCDGIGSLSQSEISSQMVTDGISRWFEGIKDLFPNSMDEETLVEDLKVTIEELNELVYDYRNRKGIDIGCTMSVILITGCHYYVFHVGDSRIYRIGDTICQITCDEVSMVEVEGRIKLLLANFMGKSSKLWMNKVTGTIEGDEIFLMGSDGLFKQLTAEDMRAGTAKIRSDSKAQKACKDFLQLVLERGERDNVSCILICTETAR